MPELPEVETVRTTLAPGLQGRRFSAVEIFDPRLTRPHAPDLVAEKLHGVLVTDVVRRGKYLIFTFGDGRHLLVHLRMTGGFRLVSPGDTAADPYRRAVVTLDDGSAVAYRDVRRFGTWLVMEADELDRYLAARLGPEPLEPGFTSRLLARSLASRRGPVKGALLDQRTVAGVGNIYADEALWRARVHPRRSARSLSEEEVRRVHRGVKDVLRAGVRRQGATLRDYRDATGREGRMQAEFRVYGRADEPCARCGTLIEKTRVAGRGTWYCPRCQELPE